MHSLNISGADSNLLCYCSPCSAPTQPGTAFHPHSCTNEPLNHFVFRFQRDAGGNGLQLYGIKANKTRVNLSVEVLWLEGIAGISGWATAPNIVDITPLFTSPCVLKYHTSDTENPFLFCIVFYTCLPFPLVLF